MSYLMHHGVKGQKWGIRKWQNEDGTLTEAGKRRYRLGGTRQFNDDLYNHAKHKLMKSKGVEPNAKFLGEGNLVGFKKVKKFDKAMKKDMFNKGLQDSYERKIFGKKYYDVQSYTNNVVMNMASEDYHRLRDIGSEEVKKLTKNPIYVKTNYEVYFY